MSRQQAQLDIEKNELAVHAGYRTEETVGVLVVDDDSMVRAQIQLGLERNGFEVWTAGDGWEAIEVYQQHRHEIAVVLLEVCIPGLDGPRTLEQLRQLDPQIQACFMSGDTGAYTQEDLRRRGAHVLAKPFYMDDLRKIVVALAQSAVGVAGRLLQQHGGWRNDRSP